MLINVCMSITFITFPLQTPDYWSFVIVVQRNEMDNPSLMTANDKTFNITCDYGNLDGTLKRFALGVSN